MLTVTAHSLPSGLAQDVLFCSAVQRLLSNLLLSNDDLYVIVHSVASA
jgi:hypothetical protein